MFHLKYSWKAALFNGETLYSSWDEVGAGGQSPLLFDVVESLIPGLQNQGI